MLIPKAIALAVLDLEKLNPGIRRTVAFLREHGFDTSDSGDGHTNVAAGMEGALDVPHVVVPAGPCSLIGEAARLHSLLRLRGIDVAPNGRRDPEGEDGAAEIHAIYDPADGSAVIVLLGVDDALLDLADDGGHPR